MLVFDLFGSSLARAAGGGGLHIQLYPTPYTLNPYTPYSTSIAFIGKRAGLE